MKKILPIILSIFLFKACAISKDSAKLNYKAIGQEPPWSVEVRNDSMLFIYGYERDSTIYKSFEHGFTDNKIIFNSNKAGKTFKLILLKEECMDVMSGEKYPYAAEVEKDSLKLSGCAREVLNDSTNRENYER